MPYYAIFCEDNPNTLELRRSVRPAHLTRLQALQAEGRLLLAGPLLGQDTAPEHAHPEGSLIIAAFNSHAEANAWASADPYTTAGVYARITIKHFKQVFPTHDDED